MASDANLIKGARDAASGGLKMAQAGGNALGAAAQGLINRVDLNTADLKKKTDEAKELRRLSDEKFADNQEAAILQGGALGEAEFDLTEKKVNGLKKQYDQCALGDTACQRKVMMQLAKESQGLTAMKDTRALNAEAMSTLRGDVSGMDKEIMGIFSNSQSGDYTIDEDPTGEKTYTFTMADGTTEVRKGNDVQKLFEMQQDAVGSQKTSDMAIAEIDRGKNGEPFDAFKVGASFDTLLKDDNSLISALHDDWGVGNFSSSIDKKIQSEIGGLNGKIDFAVEMRDKGIDIPAGEGEDNWYDNVTDEDIALIKERLMNPESDEEKAISRSVAKDYYVDAMEQQNKKGAQQAKDASDAANSKRNNENYQKELDRQSREMIARAKEEGLNSRNPVVMEQKVFEAHSKNFSKLKASYMNPDVGDGNDEQISDKDKVDKTLQFLESVVKDANPIVHRTEAQILTQYPNAIVPDNMDRFPENGGYYKVVNTEDYRTNLPNGKKNPNYGLIVEKLELIEKGHEITDLSSIRGILDLSGGTITGNGENN